MKVSAVIALFAASVAVASPAAVSLERSVKVVRDPADAQQMVPCVECPCGGFTGECRCVPNGCCCT